MEVKKIVKLVKKKQQPHKVWFHNIRVTIAVKSMCCIFLHLPVHQNNTEGCEIFVLIFYSMIECMVQLCQINLMPVE